MRPGSTACFFNRVCTAMTSSREFAAPNPTEPLSSAILPPHLTAHHPRKGVFRIREHATSELRHVLRYVLGIETEVTRPVNLRQAKDRDINERAQGFVLTPRLSEFEPSQCRRGR